VYTFWRRQVPHPLMAVFDAPSREVCSLRRRLTNTPLQALVMLNDPVFVEAAQSLGRRVAREGGASPAERVAFALRLCLVRQPRPEQVDALVRLYQSEREHYSARSKDALQVATDPLGPLPAGSDPAELAAWSVVSATLLNHDGLLTRN